MLTESDTGNAKYTKGTGATEDVKLHQKNAGWEDSNKTAEIGGQVAGTDFDFAEGDTKATVSISDAGDVTITMGK